MGGSLGTNNIYGQTTFNTELERVKFLFELYKEYTKPMMITENAKPRARKKNTWLCAVEANN